MPAQYTLPPDTRAVGTGNPPADMNAVVDAVTAMGAGANVLSAAFAGGADPTGAADSTAAIQAAINANAGGTVFLPAGIFLSGPLTLPSLTHLQGVGPGTVLKLKASAGALDNLITNQQNYSGVNDAQACVISDMILDGNSAAQSGTWNCGIVLNNDQPSGSFFYTDARHQVRNLIIQNFTGDGFVQAGRGVVQVSDVQVWLCNGFGFNLNEDSYYTNCDAGGSGLDGFLIQGGSNRLAACKSYFSGQKLVTSRTTGGLLSVSPPANVWDGHNVAGLSFSMANGWGNGFHFRDISSDTVEHGANNGGSYSAVCAQDNARAGFRITGSKQTFAAAEADSNNNNGTSTGGSGGTPTASYAGFDVDCSNFTLQGLSWERSANVNHQAAALNMASGNSRFSISLAFSGTLNDGSQMPPLLAGSATGQGAISMAAMGSGNLISSSFSSSWTPDPFASEVYAMTLTGATTVNNPAMAGTLTTGLFLIPGQRLTLILTQDGTGGRTVTLGGNFRLNGLSFSTTANATTAIPFIWDGAKWQAVS